MSGPEIITLGCRLNIAESAMLAEEAGDAPDLVIVNSCAVTQEAVRRTRQAIRRAHRRRPDARVVVTGCAAEVHAPMFAAMPEVARVVGNAAKHDPRAFLPGPARVLRPAFTALHDAPSHAAPASADRTRGFVVVQTGCDHRCTFCIIPHGRGPSRSVPMAAVADRIRMMVEGGVKEVVLTGVDVTSYGADLPDAPTLGALVEHILAAVPALPRLRLSSLDGVEIDDRLFDLLTGEARVMPHVHLSLQAGDDLILKRMKRRHTRADAVRLVERLHARRPGIAVGADIIAGFPTEDEAAFARSLSLVEDCAIVHGHVFPFSPREGTPAAHMPPVDPGLVRERAARLRAACDDRRARWLATQVGRTLSVLVERGGQDGHAADFAPVHLPIMAQAGQILSARVTGVENGRLIAQEAGHG